MMRTATRVPAVYIHLSSHVGIFQNSGSLFWGPQNKDFMKYLGVYLGIPPLFWETTMCASIVMMTVDSVGAVSFEHSDGGWSVWPC